MRLLLLMILHLAPGCRESKEDHFFEHCLGTLVHKVIIAKSEHRVWYLKVPCGYFHWELIEENRQTYKNKTGRLPLNGTKFVTIALLRDTPPWGDRI